MTLFHNQIKPTNYNYVDMNANIANVKCTCQFFLCKKLYASFSDIVCLVFFDPLENFFFHLEMSIYIRAIFFLGASTVSTFQWRGQEILSGHFFKDQQFDLNHRPSDLKTNKGHLISMGIHCTVTSLATFKQSGQEILDIERTSLGLQIDRPTEWPTDRY